MAQGSRFLSFHTADLDLSISTLIPAPSGAPRGIGIVCDSYNACQIRCTPGTDKEKLNEMAMNDEDNNNNNGNGNGKQENLPFSDASVTMLNTREKI